MRRRVLLLAAAALLFALIAGQLNHYLAAWQMHVWCGGLFVAFAGLRLDYRTGAIASFLAGLLLDAGASLPFGTQAMLLLAGHAFVFTLRARAPRDETLVGVMVALLANLGLFLALGFLRIGHAIDPGQTWLRAFSDLLLSQIFIAIVGPWYFALQRRLLELGGTNMRELSRRAL